MAMRSPSREQVNSFFMFILVLGIFMFFLTVALMNQRVFMDAFESEPVEVDGEHAIKANTAGSLLTMIGAGMVAGMAVWCMVFPKEGGSRFPMVRPFGFGRRRK